MRQPSKEERAKETSVLFTSLGDVVTTSLQLIFAVLTGSLTLLSDCIRGSLMLATTFYSLWVLHAVHRDRLARYEFGVGKIEQFVTLMVGLGLVVSGLWVVQTIIDRSFSVAPPASPLGLASAAIVNAINTLVNVAGWLAMVAASSATGSRVFRVQRRVRFTMMVNSLFLQVTMTVAALAKDDAIAFFLDVTGAIFVVSLMLVNGLAMITQALPDLLDAPAPAELGDQIRKSVVSVVPEEDIVSVRTRRRGRTAFAEVKISGAGLESATSLGDKASAINDALRQDGADVELIVTLGSEPVENR